MTRGEERDPFDDLVLDDTFVADSLIHEDRWDARPPSLSPAQFADPDDEAADLRPATARLWILRIVAVAVLVSLAVPLILLIASL